MLGSVQRFRTVSDQPFLDRGTVRRGVWFIFLKFAAFERDKMLLHIFRAESGAIKQSAAEKGLESARAASATRQVEDLNGRRRARLRDARGQPFKPQTVLLRVKASAVANEFWR